MAKRKKAQGASSAGVIVKGGDGGAAVPSWMLHGSAREHDADNLRRVLVGASIRDPRARAAFEAQLVPSSDPCERAHGQRDGSGLFYLANADRRGRARPGLEQYPARLVHRSEVAPCGLTWEHRMALAIDREQRLEAEGVTIAAGQRISLEGIVGRMLGPGDSGARARDLLQQRTRQAVSAAELELTRRASRILRRRENSPNPSAERNGGS